MCGNGLNLSNSKSIFNARSSGSPRIRRAAVGLNEPFRPNVTNECEANATMETLLQADDFHALTTMAVHNPWTVIHAQENLWETFCEATAEVLADTKLVAKYESNGLLNQQQKQQHAARLWHSLTTTLHAQALALLPKLPAARSDAAQRAILALQDFKASAEATNITSPSHGVTVAARLGRQLGGLVSAAELLAIQRRQFCSPALRSAMQCVLEIAAALALLLLTHTLPAVACGLMGSLLIRTARECYCEALQP